MFDLTELVFWHWWVLAAALVGLEMLMLADHRRRHGRRGPGPGHLR